MKKKLTPGGCIIKSAGVGFAVYAAYYVRYAVFHSGVAEVRTIIISCLVSLLFGALAFFAWTSDVKKIPVVAFRRVLFIVSLAGVTVLKLRMAWQVYHYLDFARLHTILYAAAYLMMLAAMLLLLFYYIFILRSLLDYQRAAVVIPLTAALLFLGAFVLEIIFFFAFGICLEPSVTGTMICRPAFYVGFIGVSVYFMLPPRFIVNPYRHAVASNDGNYIFKTKNADAFGELAPPNDFHDFGEFHAFNRFSETDESDGSGELNPPNDFHDFGEFHAFNRFSETDEPDGSGELNPPNDFHDFGEFHAFNRFDETDETDEFNGNP